MSVINPVINLRLSRRQSTFPLGSCLRLQPAELQVQFLAKGHCGKLLKKGESDTEILFCKSKWEGDEPQLETFGVCVCSVIRGEQHSSAEIKFPELTLTISITSGHMHTHTHTLTQGNRECLERKLASLHFHSQKISTSTVCPLLISPPLVIPTNPINLYVHHPSFFLPVFL